MKKVMLDRGRARRGRGRRARRGGGRAGAEAGAASSHREAPLISEDPSADLTDLYAFRSPDKPNTVTILANVDPRRGSGRRPELLHVLAERPVQPQDRHERRRHAGRDLPLPVPRRRRGRSSSATRRSRSRSPASRAAARRSWPAARRRRTTSARARRRLPRAGAKGVVARERRRSRVRRAARRRVLRRHRRDLRPGRDPQGHRQHGRRQGLLRRLRACTRSRCRSRSRELTGEEQHDRRLGVGRPPQGHDARRGSTRNSGRWVQVNRLGNPLVNEVIIPTGLKDVWNSAAALEREPVRGAPTGRRSSPR